MHDAADILSGLILKGLPINAQNNYGNTALMLAVVYNRIENVKVLLKAGADPNIKDNDGLSALDFAEHYGHVSICWLLLGRGATSRIFTREGLKQPPYSIPEPSPTTLEAYQRYFDT